MKKVRRIEAAASGARRPYRSDLRADASQALRSRILDVLLGRLKVEDYDLITLDTIAEDAGTTRQTVIRLFGGKGGMLEALFEQVDQQVARSRFSAGGCDLDVLAHSVVKDLETNGALVLRLLRQEQRIPFLRQRFAQARRQHLETLREELAPLLGRLDPDHAEMALLQARAVTDTLFWNVLRHDIALDPATTEATLLNLLRKIFAHAI